MPYQVTTTPIDGVLVLEPKVFGDARGFFFESFNARDFERATGVNATFVQDNHSRSAKGVLRGLHYQTQHAQGKLVRVIHGTVFDVVVDIRKTSPTFGQWFGQDLSDENKKQMWIPAGLAHGFLVTSESAELLYKTTDYYCSEYERSISWKDQFLKIKWPLSHNEVPLISPKDAAAESFFDSLRS